MKKQNPTYKERGDRLYEFMIRKGYTTKKDMAGALGLFPQYINNYLNGLIDPVNIADRLLELGCNVNWLISGQGKLFNEARAESASECIATDDLEMLRMLKSGGIDTPHKARALLQQISILAPIIPGIAAVVSPEGRKVAEGERDLSELTKFIKKPSRHKTNSHI